MRMAAHPGSRQAYGGGNGKKHGCFDCCSDSSVGSGDVSLCEASRNSGDHGRGHGGSNGDGDIGYLLGLAAEQAVLCVSLGFCEAFYMLHNPRIYSKVERSIKVIDKGAQDDRRHHGNDDFVNLTGG